MPISYTNAITVLEVNAMRKLIGWRRLNAQQLEASLQGSTFIVAAYDCGKAIGMARLIWDGGSVAVVPDILVVPEYQNQEIETEMLTQILDFLRAKLKPGFGIQVDIRAWNECEPVYASLGFQKSLPEQRGVPMHICLTDQIELTDRIFGQYGFSKDAIADG